MNWHTTELLADRGFLYDSSLLDGDKPYLMATSPASERTLIEIPVDWHSTTGNSMRSTPVSPAAASSKAPPRSWRCGPSKRRPHAEGGCFVLTNHPFISGRPSKAAALERLIENVKAMDGMWATTLGDIAARPARLHRTLRTHPIRSPHLPRRPDPADFPGPRNCSLRTVRDPQSSTVTPYSVASVARSYSYP